MSSCLVLLIFRQKLNNALLPLGKKNQIINNVENILLFPAPSRLALGVEDRRIPDGGFSASSSWDRNHGPKRARLNIIRRGRLTGAWSSRVNNRAQWLLIDITKQARVVGFAIQGRQDYNQWVVSLRISHSVGGIKFRYYTERRRAKVCSSAFLFYNIECRRGGGACNLALLVFAKMK